MNTCKTCKWWQLQENRYNSVIAPYDHATAKFLDPADETAIRAQYGHAVRFCTSPKVLFYQRPEHDGAAVCDGSEYDACLLAAEDFGCVLHEPIDAVDEAMA